MIRLRRISSFIIVLLIIFLFVGCNNAEEEGTQNQEDQNIENIPSDISIDPSSTLIIDDYNNVDREKLNKYVIDVEFNSEEKIYNAVQRVVYVNNEDVELSEVYFHIYPNIFRSKDTAPFLFDSFQDAYPDGFESGYINIEKISLDNEPIKDFSIEGAGKTILRVPLKTSLKQGGAIDIDMEYEVKMPPAQDRFGYGEKTFNFGNWYPIAAVYDDEGWNLDPYYRIGDPFYSDTSNYEVTIITPKDIIVAASGTVLSEEEKEDKKIWRIKADLMRDFAWVASEHFIKTEKNIDGTLVKVYFLEDDEAINDFVSEVSYSSIRIFNDRFGKYPYSQYSVVATSFPSGMEYPGIVFIGEKYYDKQYMGYLEIVVAHETGHQWWYSVVGNDEVDEAWLDESLTTYSEVVYAEEQYGEDVGENYYANNVESGYKHQVSILSGREVVVKPLSEFENWTDYGALVYNKGAMFINEIEERYGEEVLYEILNTYFEKYKFLNATTEGFIEVCEEVTGDNLEIMVSKWLYGR